MKYTKEEAASIAIKGALKYKSELLNRTLLFICLDKHKKVHKFEFSFRKRNYMHLTGLTPVKFTDNNREHILSASEFFNMCIAKSLKTNQFEFNDDGNTPLKLAVLPKMICKNLSANAIGDYDSFTPKLQTEKLVGKANGVMGFVLDMDEHKFLPNTLLNADIRDLSKSSIRIIATFRKYEKDTTYQEITYRAKNIDWNRITLPKEISYLKPLLIADNF